MNVMARDLRDGTAERARMNSGGRTLRRFAVVALVGCGTRSTLPDAAAEPRSDAADDSGEACLGTWCAANASDALFCDDFETGKLNGWSNSGAPTITTSPSSGMSAVRVKTAGVPNGAP